MDGAGNLYVADSLNHKVRKISPNGIIATAVGAGASGFGGDTGPPPLALLHAPRGVALDPASHLYIADSMNARVRRVDPGGAIVTWAGNGNFSYYGDGGPARSGSVNRPGGVAADGNGNVFVADTWNSVVRKIAADGTISTMAGTGGQGYAGDGGPAAKALLNHPEAVAVDASGNLFIADTGNHRLRKVDATGVITTLAGESSLNSPAGVAVDPAGTIYVADTGHNRVVAVGADGAVSTIAGSGQPGYSGDGGPAVSAALNRPWGIALDASGNIYISEAGNNAIRVLQPAGTAPRVSAVVNGASNQPGAIAPGEILVIYGSGIGPATLSQSQFDAGGRVGPELSGSSVLFNGIPAPVIYASFTQVGVVAPYGITGDSVAVAARFGGASAPAVALPLAAAVPAIFTQDSSGRGQAAAVNQDYSINGPARPAAPGSYITLYATGEGQTSPPGVDGKMAPAQPPKPVLQVTAT
ncbi:MAG: hypothetical protein LAQ30_30425, partial [Acidobacteriia bacterium]|nr:hypothetical protein [Terriglobia bacterium]